MLKKRFSILGLLGACFMCCCLLVGTGFYWLHGNIGSVTGMLKLMQTRKLIERNYVSDVDVNTLYQGALKGMVAALDDPYSTFLDKKDFEDLYTATEGHFGGIGAVLSKKDQQVIVIAPIEDTPAYRAGIKSGDIILAIDGEAVTGQELESVVKKLRGQDGTDVSLEVQSGTEAPRTIKLTRSDIKIKSVSGKMQTDKVGYIRINSFTEQTGVDFAKQYGELEQQGMQALILDLRDNPGGLLKTGVEVAKYLVPKGPIVSIKEKDGTTTTEESRLAKVKYPLAVLVNNGTASAAEIVSGAIQDTGSGKLFGTKTYGKGVVQTVFPMTGDTAVKLTMAKYYTPSGRSIDKVGIAPDVEVVAEGERGLTQLQAALEYLQGL